MLGRRARAAWCGGHVLEEDRLRPQGARLHRQAEWNDHQPVGGLPVVRQAVHHAGREGVADEALGRRHARGCAQWHLCLAAAAVVCQGCRKLQPSQRLGASQQQSAGIRALGLRPRAVAEQQA
eukprot:8970218-Pyramimonas_sp.AAC.1